MNQEWCICKEDPCRCFHGWGTHFRLEAELLEAIDEEIERSIWRSGIWMSTGSSPEWVRKPRASRDRSIYSDLAFEKAASRDAAVERALRDGLAGDVADLRADGLTIGEIADELGIPEWLVNRVLKRMKRKKRNRRARQDEW